MASVFEKLYGMAVLVFESPGNILPLADFPTSQFLVVFEWEPIVFGCSCAPMWCNLFCFSMLVCNGIYQFHLVGIRFYLGLNFNWKFWFFICPFFSSSRSVFICLLWPVDSLVLTQCLRTLIIASLITHTALIDVFQEHFTRYCRLWWSLSA